MLLYLMLTLTPRKIHRELKTSNKEINNNVFFGKKKIKNKPIYLLYTQMELF